MLIVNNISKSIFTIRSKPCNYAININAFIFLLKETCACLSHNVSIRYTSFFSILYKDIN